MSTEDPLERLVLLRQRVTATMAERGLVVHHLAVAPAPELHGGHEIYIVATAAEGPTTAKCVDEFDDVLRSAATAETDLRAAQAQERLRRVLDQGEGFLPPPSPSGE